MSEERQRKPFPAALAHLKDVKGWLVWRYVTDEKGKTTKVPFQPRAPDYRASNKKPEHWSTFKVARAVWKAGKADGIGFVVKSSGYEVWIDLDDCRNPKTGAIAEWAQRFIDMAGSYTEITPSGAGIRIVGRLAGALSGKPIHIAYKLPGGHKGEIFYRATRYVTVTGDRLPEMPDTLGPVDETVSMILRENGNAKDREEVAGEIVDDDDIVASLDPRPPMNLSAEQIRGYMANLPPADHKDENGDAWWTYPKFMEVVFAVHDETDGSEDGFELLDEWAQTTPHYDAEGLRKKWESARGSHTGEARTTFRVIIKWANEHTAPQRREELNDLIDEIVQARSISELEDAQKKAQDLKVDSPGLRAVLVAQYRAAFRRITGMNIGESKAHGLLAFRDPMLTEMPDWLRSFCWVSGRGEFYDAQTGQMFSPQVFDITFGRRFMSDEEISQGNDAPSVVPSKVVVTRYQIPVAAELGYKPIAEKKEKAGDGDLDGSDDVAILRRPRIYTRDGVRYVNRYHSRGAVPAVYGPWTREQKDDIRAIKALYHRVCGSDRDTAIFLSVLKRAVVEKKRSKFACVLMGAERSGKTTAAQTIPTLLLGEENVGIYGPTVLLDKTDGSWRDGHLWKVIEELWVPDYARTAVIENMKPCITNSLVPARFMFKGARQVENTATYVGLTNHDDVLALTSADTRFYPICNEKTATRRAMDVLLAEDPGFYDRVFLAVERSIGCFKGWLETRFEYHEDFQPETGRAPESSVKERIIDLGRDELTQDILDVLDAAPTPLLTRHVVCVTSLRNYLIDKQKQITHTGDRKRASEVLGAALRKIDMRPRGQFRLPCIWNADADDDPLAGGADNRTRIYTSGAGPLDAGALTTDRIIEYERYGDL